MNSLSFTKSRVAALIVAFVLTGALAAGAAASGTRGQGADAAAMRALHLRSEALNTTYGLGDATVVDPSSVAAAVAALTARSEALNAQYHLGPYAIVRPTTGFRWVDAAIGAAGMLGIVLVAGGLAAGIRRFRSVAEAAAPTV